MKHFLAPSAFLFGATLALTSPASAAIVDAEAMLKSFTTISLGDATIGSESLASVYVGGNLTSNGFNANPGLFAPGSAGPVTGSLIVGGNVGGADIHIKGGNAQIGGSASATLDMQTGGTSSYTGVAGIPVAGVSAAFQQLSLDLSGLASTAGAMADQSDFNQKKLVSGSGSAGVAVINTNASFFNGGTLSTKDFDPGVTTIINVSGTTASVSLNANDTNTNVILNFFEATDVLLNAGGFGYAILAPLAHVGGSGGGVNGSVVGLTINQNQEFRMPFTGELPPVSTVPVPAAGLLLIGGLAGLGFAGRRRKAA